MIRILQPSTPWTILLEVKAVLDKEFAEDVAFIKSLPGAKFVAKAKAWEVSSVALPRLWEWGGLERCDWFAPPWELGLCDAPNLPGPIVPDADEASLFKGEILDFQSYSASFLYQRRKAIVADDVGVGKTATSIRAMLKARMNGEVRRTLVVTRTSLKKQWAMEVQKFTDLRSHFINGTRKKRERDWTRAFEEADVVVVNYEQLLLDLDFSFMERWRPECIIFDEVHYLKSHTAQRTQRALELVNSVQPEFVWGLSATPTTGKLEEIWSLFQFINPSLLGKISHFHDRFCIKSFKKTADGLRFSGFRDYKNRSTLNSLTAPWILFRDVKEVSDQLPKVVTIHRTFEPTSGQRKLFARLEARMEELERKIQEAPAAKMQELQDAQTGTLMMMTMAAADTELLATSESEWVRRFAEGISHSSPKLQGLLEDAQSWIDAGHKFLVFTEFVRMTEKIADRLSTLRFYDEATDRLIKLPVGIITGDVSPTRRDAIVEEFKAYDHPAALVLDRAGQEGLNLQNAGIVALFDLPWSPTDVQQRIGRIRRLQSPHDFVRLYFYIVEGSIDENMLKLHERRLRDIGAVAGMTTGEAG